MSAAPTGPAAHSIPKQTASTSIRTQASIRCETFQPSSPRLVLKPLGAFFDRPPNPARMRMARPGEGVCAGDAGGPVDLEGPEDLADSPRVAGLPEAAGPAVRDPVLAEGSDRADSPVSPSACKACR